jgi:hypothetical protein
MRVHEDVPLFLFSYDGETYVGRPACIGSNVAAVDGVIILEQDDGTLYLTADLDEVEPITAAAREVLRWAKNEAEFEEECAGAWRGEEKGAQS